MAASQTSQGLTVNRWNKIADRVWVMPVRMTIKAEASQWRDRGEVRVHTFLRLDGRGLGGWHVDKSDLGIYETILDGGILGDRPQTLAAAKKVAQEWKRNCREYRTANPHIKSSRVK